MKVAVVAEFYPRRGDPVLGVWAHRQALAARAAGAEVHVLVLHRLVPPRASFSGPSGPAGAARALGGLLREGVGESRHQLLDGVPVTYVPYVSPHAPATTPLGARGRRPRWRWPCAGCAVAAA